jgi:hypothetical protein
VPRLQNDPLYDEPVNIDMEPEEALQVLLGVERCEDMSEKD